MNVVQTRPRKKKVVVTDCEKENVKILTRIMYGGIKYTIWFKYPWVYRRLYQANYVVGSCVDQ